MLIHDMFVLKIAWIEKVIRPVIVYCGLVLLLRAFGKRELAQLNPFDLVVLLAWRIPFKMRLLATTIPSLAA